MSQLVFLGTGGAADPDLPNTSMLYTGVKKILLDCGYSVPQSLWRMTQDPSLLDAIFISHAHADHSFGLPALLLWMRDAGRRRPLDLLCSESVFQAIKKMMEMAYPGLLKTLESFLRTDTLLWPGEDCSLGPLHIRVAESDHLSENLALRIDTKNEHWAYSGDGNLNEDTASIFEGAALVVHECFELKPVSTGHANLDRLVEELPRRDVKHVALVHLARSCKNLITDASQEFGGQLKITIPSPRDSLSL